MFIGARGIDTEGAGRFILYEGHSDDIVNGDVGRLLEQGYTVEQLASGGHLFVVVNPRNTNPKLFFRVGPGHPANAFVSSRAHNITRQFLDPEVLAFRMANPLFGARFFHQMGVPGLSRRDLRHGLAPELREQAIAFVDMYSNPETVLTAPPPINIDPEYGAQVFWYPLTNDKGGQPADSVYMTDNINNPLLYLELTQDSRLQNIILEMFGRFRWSPLTSDQTYGIDHMNRFMLTLDAEGNPLAIDLRFFEHLPEEQRALLEQNRVPGYFYELNFMVHRPELISEYESLIPIFEHERMDSFHHLLVQRGGEGRFIVTFPAYYGLQAEVFGIENEHAVAERYGEEGGVGRFAEDLHRGAEEEGIRLTIIEPRTELDRALQRGLSIGIDLQEMRELGCSIQFPIMHDGETRGIEALHGDVSVNHAMPFRTYGPVDPRELALGSFGMFMSDRDRAEFAYLASSVQVSIPMEKLLDTEWENIPRQITRSNWMDVMDQEGVPSVDELESAERQPLETITDHSLINLLRSEAVIDLIAYLIQESREGLGNRVRYHEFGNRLRANDWRSQVARRIREGARPGENPAEFLSRTQRIISETLDEMETQERITRVQREHVARRLEEIRRENRWEEVLERARRR